MTIKRKKSKTVDPERRNRIAAMVLLGVAFVAILLIVTRGNPLAGPSNVVDLTSLRIEIADSDPARTQGLSGRESMDADAGMLFVFDASGIYPFWMKDMKFPLDMVWIDDGKVVDVATLRQPVPTELVPPSHIPSVKASLVLELNAGKATELGLVKGTYVILSR
jgi:hypothetical protein